MQRVFLVAIHNLGKDGIKHFFGAVIEFASSAAEAVMAHRDFGKSAKAEELSLEVRKKIAATLTTAEILVVYEAVLRREKEASAQRAAEVNQIELANT